MSKIKLFILLITFNFQLFATPPIQLVESVPVNTSYESSNLPRTQAIWLDMLIHAQHSIIIGSFFFATAPHSSMQNILTALNDAARRGVKIKILIDQSMQQQSADAINQLTAKNISVRYINFRQLSRGVMHAKYMVVDEEDNFVGSQNFSWKAISQNHELGIRIHSTEIAKNLLAIFNLDWQLSQRNHSHEKKIYTRHDQFNLPSKVVLPFNGSDAELYSAFSPKKFLPSNATWELPYLLNLIDHAQQQILIQVYQYSDLSGKQLRGRWTTLDKALIQAAHRGVKINLVVSDAMLKNFAGIKGLDGLKNIPNIAIKMSSIPLYQGQHGIYSRVDHSKFMLIDNTISWIGTSNWQKNYFYNSRDIAIIIYNKNINSELQKVFWQNWQGSYVRDIKNFAY